MKDDDLGSVRDVVLLSTKSGKDKFVYLNGKMTSRKDALKYKGTPNEYVILFYYSNIGLIIWTNVGKEADPFGYASSVK